MEMSTEAGVNGKLQAIIPNALFPHSLISASDYLPEEIIKLP